MIHRQESPTVASSSSAASPPDDPKLGDPGRLGDVGVDVG
jgi:hypothetical protein